MTATPDAHVPELALFDPTSPLRATGNLGRRGAVSRAVEVICIAGAAVAVAFMAEVVWTVIHRGASVLSFGFVTRIQLAWWAAESSTPSSERSWSLRSER